MKKLFDKILLNREKLSSAVLILLSIIITVYAVFSGGTLKSDNAMIDADSVAEYVQTKDTNTIQLQTEAKNTDPSKSNGEKNKNSDEKEEGKTDNKETEDKTEGTKAKSNKKETKPTEATEPSIPFATAIPPDKPVDYTKQWNAGYLVAIDNPDTIYQCSKVTLSDSDRDLLERLCMGEFGSGGFVGAALIAQAVKNAICFDGYTSVKAVIKECHYTGSTKIAPNEDCKKAVRYIFDQNKDAVQHRIMYMYNPSLVQSAFHESQNYIMTYQGVRFFDRWGH